MAGSFCWSMAMLSGSFNGRRAIRRMPDGSSRAQGAPGTQHPGQGATARGSPSHASRRDARPALTPSSAPRAALRVTILSQSSQVSRAASAAREAPPKWATASEFGEGHPPPPASRTPRLSASPNAVAGGFFPEPSFGVLLDLPKPMRSPFPPPLLVPKISACDP